MTMKELMNMKEAITTTKEAAVEKDMQQLQHTVLSKKTIALLRSAKYHSFDTPYTDVSDGLRQFYVTYITYNNDVLTVQGVIAPVGCPEKGAHFLYQTVGSRAANNVSDIMAKCSTAFAQQRTVYRMKRKAGMKCEYPLWKTPINDLVVDDVYLVKVSHNDYGFIDIEFAEWKFTERRNK